MRPEVVPVKGVDFVAQRHGGAATRSVEIWPIKGRDKGGFTDAGTITAT
jgi:hypothetical protein